jgi:hypothetical protein
MSFSDRFLLIITKSYHKNKSIFVYLILLAWQIEANKGKIEQNLGI